MSEKIIERRSMNVEIRALVDGEKRTIEGYAAVFGQWSEDLGGFREKILPGAFSGVLERGDDVRALVNHDPNLVLGRTASGTLRLQEDEAGLRVSVQLPDTQYARDLISVLERGDVNQMSFGFEVARDRWYEENGQTYRELIDIARLYDVSVVTFPAYPQTIAAARDVLNARSDYSIQVDEDARAETSRSQGRLDVMRRKIEILKLKIK
ncbi:MAG: hypothetical protein KatS3mg054_0652 [Chloroflexus sp.]|nr:MAG: hypothetical protein KatS3mg054_0652 [Chloroflexus sp.]